MATTFLPNKPVDVKPLHNGTVIYADDTCLRTVSSDQLGGGGIEGIAPLFFLLAIVFSISEPESFLENILIWGGIGILLIILPIIISRYKPNYLVFSRKTQEIYYVKDPKTIVKIKWQNITGEYRKVTIFTGSGMAQIETLRLNGTSQYGNSPATPASIPFVVMDEEQASQLWAYLQAYMDNGVEGLEPPSYDRVKHGFWDEVKRVTKLWFYVVPSSDFYNVFSPKSDFNIFYRILYLPVAIFYLPFNIIFTWPGSIATAFVEYTRKRAQFPQDLLSNITNNPECYGKEP